MKKEIKACTKLWRDQITGGLPDMGDAIGNGLASWARSYAPIPTSEQLDIFENTLSDLMLTEIIEGNYWDLENPTFGSYTLGRWLTVDYGMCSILKKSIETSGINDQLIPIKSDTWIYPGYVEYRFGDSAKKQRLDV